MTDRPRTGVIGLAAFSLLLSASGSDCGEESFEWDLTWQDEFDGPLEELPDSTRWRFDVGTGWGNQQLEYDTDRATNVSLDGEGHLAIVAREELYAGQRYTSGRINTRGLFAQAGGRFEARIKLPYGQGIWPAFWLLGNDFPAVGWPTCGEIDILEYRGQQTNRVLGSLHGPGYSGGASITQTYDRPGQGFYRDFHVFGIEWDSNRISWTVDDVRYHSVSRDTVTPRGPWVFDHPFFIILNVAVGGTFVGSPDSTTSFPQTMLVDWVRVYRGKT